MSRRVRETIHTYRHSLMAAMEATNTERCLDLLEHLSQTKMTVSLLMETGVAKTLTRLKKETTDEDIRRLTKSLLQQWKAMVRRHNQRVEDQEESSSRSLARTDPFVPKSEPRLHQHANHMTTSMVCNVKVAHIRPRYSNLKEWMKDERNVYIGRSGIVFVENQRFPKTDSPWCNPFKISKKPGGDGRKEVLEKYERYIRQKLQDTPSLKTQLFKDLDGGKRLGCWCYPEACHGHVLLRIMEEIRGLEDGTNEEKK